MGLNNYLPDWLSGSSSSESMPLVRGTENSIPGVNGVGSPNTGVPSFTSPGAPGSGFGTGLGMNVGTAQLGLGILGTLGNAYSAFQANGLAAKQFNLSRDVANTNMVNSIKSYNTRLEDTARSRASAEGTSFNAGEYVDRNRLTR